MRIAMLWPDYWPYIRRGTERMVHDMTRYLVDGGHTVDIIASKPGRARTVRDGNVTVHYLPQANHPLLMGRRLVPRFDTHGLMALPRLLRGRYDLVHAFFYTYGPSLRLSRLLHRAPYVYHVVSIPPHWARPLDRSLLSVSLDGAAAVRVFSQFCADHMRDNYGVDSFVLAPTVDAATFQPDAAPRRAGHPTILFTADLADRRKGGRILLRAFSRVHAELPLARLQLAGPIGFVTKETQEALDPSATDAVELLGPGSLRSLPKLYAGAAVTVLPSRDEPFGMVLTESLAAGTPVVGSNTGAAPEIVNDPSIGTLFDLEPADEEESGRRLAAAILRTLELGREPGIRERCRERAMHYTWAEQGPRLERLQAIALADARTPVEVPA